MPRSRRRARSKTLSRHGVLGQRGINLIERIVLEMGCTWTPTGANEIGIDGFIELFDPPSGVPLGKILAVQSKAVSTFQNETDGSFDYWCAGRDLDYWLRGNTPVLLIVSRPATNEAYWIHVQRHFANSPNSTRIRFLKETCRFASPSFDELLNLGRPISKGLYLAPRPTPELLHSNLLELSTYPATLFVADTKFRVAGALWAALKETDQPIDGAWLLREGKIFSFHDLSTAPWSALCDLGTLEGFESSEWGDSDDAGRHRTFVQLLNLTLRAQIARRARYWPDQDCFAFVGLPEKQRRKVAYASLKRESRISAVTRFSAKAGDQVFEWFRHMAFRGQFRRVDGRWYLEITPTYRFTQDGWRLDRFHEERLRGIKRIEGNRAVLSAVLFWAGQLKTGGTLFHPDTPPLQFGDVLSLELPVGVNDQEWQSRESAGDSRTSDQGDLVLWKTLEADA